MSAVEVVQIASNAVVALVVPVLAWLAKKLFNQQVDLLKARNDLLRETQFDRAVAIIQSQRAAYEIERQHLENRIDSLRREGESASEELAASRSRLAELTSVVTAFEKDSAAASREAMLRAVFGDEVTVVGWNVAHPVNLSSCRFEAPVHLRNVHFDGGVDLQGADLRRVNMNGALLQGIDLSRALIDLNTKLPKVHYGSPGRYKS